jgi:hypothetical protein
VGWGGWGGGGRAPTERGRTATAGCYTTAVFREGTSKCVEELKQEQKKSGTQVALQGRPARLCHWQLGRAQEMNRRIGKTSLSLCVCVYIYIIQCSGLTCDLRKKNKKNVI